MLLSFQEQRQSCLVSLGTDTDIRSQEWQSHPNNHTVCLLQARDGQLSHAKNDFLKDSASKRSLKYGTGELLLFICGMLSNEKGSRALLCPKTTFPFCCHTSHSLLKGLELLWSPSVLALSFHLPSSRYFFAPCQGLVWKGSQEWSREENGQRYQQQLHSFSICSPCWHSVRDKHYGGSPHLYTVHKDQGRHGCCPFHLCSNETLSERFHPMPISKIRNVGRATGKHFPFLHPPQCASERTCCPWMPFL